ncbi:MAG: LytTR family DNA-binding domain-containing protein [Oscillospiraceae bacterium]|nr:LytTR family DNA-binding domain-containing protein [Oscillospiraceae bacterium]
MYRIAVLDYFPSTAFQLSVFLNNAFEKIGRSCQIFHYQTLEELQATYSAPATAFNLIFLDVSFNASAVLEFAKTLHFSNKSLLIILTSNDSGCAVSGYECGAVGYLVKPYHEEKIKATLTRIFTQSRKDKILVMKEGARTRVFSLTDIYCFESMDKTIMIRFSSHSELFTAKLNNIFSLLPKHMFIQCHKSYIVNMQCITQIKKFEISLSNGIVVPVGKQRYAQVYQEVLNFFSSK